LLERMSSPLIICYLEKHNPSTKENIYLETKWRKAPKRGPGKAPKWGPPGL
jgi:hypothetical protein